MTGHSAGVNAGPMVEIIASVTRRSTLAQPDGTEHSHDGHSGGVDSVKFS